MFQCFFQLSKFGERAGIVTLKSVPQVKIFIDNVHSPPRKFERYWFIVTPPKEFWDAPLEWCWYRKNPIEVDLDKIRELYRNELAILTLGDKMSFSEILTPQNLLNAGWGIQPESSSSSGNTSSPSSNNNSSLPMNSLDLESFPLDSNSQHLSLTRGNDSCEASSHPSHLETLQGDRRLRVGIAIFIFASNFSFCFRRDGNEKISFQ